ncbi:hypothetical protein B0J18DRAFT_211304 [Chaetomium sp. MPI-SDFR-AT-0129]|nr:hypothetical protein B0J18DRAFT_211304 [Chaetomium sp. MPI-SDFR-AT-0129]
MIFSDLVRSPRTTFSKFRNSLPHSVPPPQDLNADLVIRDKAKSKEAVRKYLAEKVRNDWVFTWPPVESAPSAPEDPAQATTENGAQEQTAPVALVAGADADNALRDAGEEADSESDAESVYSTLSDDPTSFRPRAEWTSDLSDDEVAPPSASPFRFDSPEAVGEAVHNTIEAKRAQRRRAVREEVQWNTGLACFEARRNAWTGAKTVRVKPKPPTPVSPTTGRRLFWRQHRTQSTGSHSAVLMASSPSSAASPVSSTAPRSSTTTTSDSDSAGVQRTTSQESNAPVILYPIHTVVPVGAPLLPPQNPMRASIQPSMYSSLYDKVVVQSLQPSCPINLSDMLGACVVGWKRDGEWPPRSVYPVPAPLPVVIPHAEALSLRQRKAQQQRHKSTASNATATSGRRLSLVGLFGSGGGSKTTGASATAQEVKDKEIKENAAGSHSQSHSDEGAGSGGALRRSLRKVFSLGQHGQPPAGTQQAGGGNETVAQSVSPTNPAPAKEITAAS